MRIWNFLGIPIPNLSFQKSGTLNVFFCLLPYVEKWLIITNNLPYFKCKTNIKAFCIVLVSKHFCVRFWWNHQKVFIKKTFVQVWFKFTWTKVNPFFLIVAKKTFCRRRVHRRSHYNIIWFIVDYFIKYKVWFFYCNRKSYMHYIWIDWKCKNCLTTNNW